MEEDPSGDNLIKLWRDYTTGDAIIVREKAMKANKTETQFFFWRKLCPDVVHDFTWLTTEPIKSIIRDCENGKNSWEWRVSRHDLWEIQELTDTMPAELTEDWLDGENCFWTSARWWEKKKHWSNVQKPIDIGSVLTTFDFFYSMDTSFLPALKLKQTVKLFLQKHFYRNKEAKSHIEITMLFL